MEASVSLQSPKDEHHYKCYCSFLELIPKAVLLKADRLHRDQKDLDFGKETILVSPALRSVKGKKQLKAS